MNWSELKRNGHSLFWSAMRSVPCLIQIRELELGKKRHYLVEIVDGRVNELKSFGRYTKLEEAKSVANQHAVYLAELAAGIEAKSH